jgi:peptidoglycan/xylan/chitin deacetylase (PgdA/CDA1 family)
MRGSALALILLLLGSAASAADSVVVLMYHRFGETGFPSTNVRAEQFAEHLEFLSDNGFEIVPLRAVIESLVDGVPLPENAVAITIDDAYRSVYDVAHPMLARYGAPYTVFVATDGVDDAIPDYMSWAQMRELEAEGASFANHGAAHAALIDRTTSDDYVARARNDVERGMTRLREELEPLESVFAYPYGEFNEAIIAVIDDLGYRLAFGQHSGAIGPMSRLLALPRYPINEAYASIADFRTRVRSLPLPVERVDPPENEIETRLPLVTFELPGGIDSGDYPGLACFVSGQGRVTVDWLVPNERFRSGPDRPLPPGRNRINCTAPAGDGRYYWYSHPWFVLP